MFWVPPKPSLVPSEPALVPQALLTGQELQPHHLGCLPSAPISLSMFFPAFEAVFLMWSECREEGMIPPLALRAIYYSWHSGCCWPSMVPGYMAGTCSACCLAVPPELLPGPSLHHCRALPSQSRAQCLSLLNFTGSPSCPSSYLSRSCSPALKYLTTAPPAWCLYAKLMQVHTISSPRSLIEV